MQIEIDLTKSVDENAGKYFDLAKKFKKKLKGAQEAVKKSQQELEKLQKQEDKFLEEEAKKQAKKSRKKEWYEKFHWFVSSEGFLCIGGKDATSNEIVIKKHTDKEDIVMHTEMPGSPFFVIKNGQEAGEITLNETAQAVAVYSKEWKLGHTQADVFYVNPDQVTKEAKSGEHIAKGSFMVYGKRNFLHPKLEYAIGLVEDNIIGGPITAIEKQTNKFVKVIAGREKKSATAKKVRAKLKGGDLDEIIKFLPSGGAQIKKK